MMNKRPEVLRSRWKGEHNDCTVRAFAVAFNLDYELAHSFLRHNGRKLKHRFNLRQLLPATIAEPMPLEIATLGNIRLLDQEHAYIAEVRGHIVGWRDGLHSDLGVCSLKPNQRIKHLWRIPKA